MKKHDTIIEFEMKMYFIITWSCSITLLNSNAENTTLSLQEVENELLIHVWDNGTGFDTNEYNTIEGFGLNQIQARINNMEGELVIKSKLNSGTSIHLKVPILHTC
jgi:signal transduction histidine kinase